METVVQYHHSPEMQRFFQKDRETREKILRTADFAIRFGAGKVYCYVHHEQLPPALVIENTSGHAIQFFVFYSDYAVQDMRSEEVETTRLYIHALALIRTHCDLGGYEKQGIGASADGNL